MTNDDQQTRAIEAWLEATSTAPPPADASVDRVMSHVPHTPQERRRWWSGPFRRRIDASGDQDQPPDRTGRTRSMFTAATTATAAALIFALGGAMLIALPLEQDGAVAPAAESGTGAEPVEFSAKYAWDTAVIPEFSERLPDGTRRNTGGVGAWRAVEEATDPRLRGRAYYHWNHDEFGTGGSERSRVSNAMVRIVDAAGSWQSPPVVYGQVGAGGATWPIALVGEGAYQGLYAVGTISNANASGIWELDGLIYEGELLPEPVPYEPE